MINYNTLNELVDLDDNNDPALLLELVDLFQTRAPELLTVIHDNIILKNYDVIYNTAHALKGSCGCLGIESMQNLCYDLEEWTKTPNAAADKGFEIYQDLLLQYQEALSALKTYITQQPSSARS